ncbi:MAG: thiolase family protein [Bdellovibrionales bacterium]|nr:thiolase family protein [Bdellovibrionales bacterium]
MSSEKAFLIEGLRTPFVKAGKEFKDIHPKDLGITNLKEFLYKMNFKGNEIDELIFGNSICLPDSPNIARIISLSSGLSHTIPATTIHKNCASSMESFFIAVNKIERGYNQSVIAGGVESMSYTPFILPQSLTYKLQSFILSKKLKQKISSLLQIKKKDLKLISPILEGLKDPFTGYSMGETAEILVREFNISRKEQDFFAMNSHKKAFLAKKRLKEELFPFFTPNQVVFEDLGVREKISEKRMSKLSGFFDPKYGTVTIANSCPINDGSSLVLLMSETKMKQLGLKPLASIVSTSVVGLEPERMGLGPVYATNLALKKAHLKLKDIDLFEINEAFAGQVLSCLKAFNSKKFAEEKLRLKEALGEVDRDKLNVNGGAIAIGHPIAATGTRLILTLAKEMKRRQATFGLASLCVGGGQGGAVILKQA